MLVNERPEQFSLGYDAKPCQPEDIVFCFWDGHVLLRTDESARRLPTWGEVATFCDHQEPTHAFTQGSRRCFLLNPPSMEPAPDGFVWEQARVFRILTPQEDSYALMVALHLSAWYAKHRYCGVCGGSPVPAETERALVCPQCGLVQYPTISPAVIVAITDGGRLLLARNAHGVFRHFSLIAGYVEAGETLEQTVRREIMEEVGLRVKDVRYISSQPWGLSQSLMIGFHAQLDGSPAITLQTSELAEAEWFRADELPEHAGPASIAYELIDLFRQGRLV